MGEGWIGVGVGVGDSLKSNENELIVGSAEAVVLSSASR